MRSSPLPQMLSVTLALLILIGCQDGVPVATVTAIPPSVTPTSTATSTLTLTPTPTITPTPLPPPLPSVFGGHLPTGAYAILGLGEIVAVDLSPNGKYLAVLTGIGLGVYKVEDLEPIWFAVIRAESLSTGGIEWSPDGSKIAIAVYRDAIIWDVQKHQELLRINRLEMYEHPYGYWDSIAWAPDSSVLAVGGDGEEILLWDISTGNTEASKDTEALLEFDLIEPEDTIISPDGLAAIAIDNNRVVIQDAETRMEIKTAHQIVGTAAESVAWSADGNMLAVQSGCTMTVCVSQTIDTWDVHTATPLDTQYGDTAPGYDFEYEFPDISPDNTRQLEYSITGPMTLKSSDTGQVIREIQPYDFCEGGQCLFLAWSPDSTRLAVTLIWELYFWDAHTGVQLKDIGPHPFGDSLAFSPDSKLLATTVGGAVIVWEVP